MDTNEVIGLITLMVSIVGFIVATVHARFYLDSHKNLSIRLKWVFISDALIYLITGVFGFWAVFQGDLYSAIVYQFVRVPILLLNIVAGVRLYLTYKEIYREEK
jgi:cell shape-determining protein MreD